MNLGMKIIGVALAIVGVSSVFKGHPLSEEGGVADMVTGGLMFVTGVAIFLWGFRRDAGKGQ